MIERRTYALGIFLIGILSWGVLSCTETVRESPVDPLEDSPRQRAMVDSIGAALAGPMKARSAEEALLVELDELYQPLTPEQREFMEAIRNLDGADPSRGVASGIDWIRVEDQQVMGPAGEQTMSLQLLPENVWLAFGQLNEAMKKDLGHGLVIGSGYRTPANQLSIFVTYMPYYEYSAMKTLPHVSLPGASDHNRIERQGLDFVSESGVDLRYSDSAAFRALAEHQWLLANAERFGFVGEGVGSASPWHWHFVSEL